MRLVAYGWALALCGCGLQAAGGTGGSSASASASSSASAGGGGSGATSSATGGGGSSASSGGGACSSTGAAGGCASGVCEPTAPAGQAYGFDATAMGSCPAGSTEHAFFECAPCGACSDDGGATCALTRIDVFKDPACSGPPDASLQTPPCGAATKPVGARHVVAFATVDAAGTCSNDTPSAPPASRMVFCDLAAGEGCAQGTCYAGLGGAPLCTRTDGDAMCPPGWSKRKLQAADGATACACACGGSVDCFGGGGVPVTVSEDRLDCSSNMGHRHTVTLDGTCQSSGVTASIAWNQDPFPAPTKCSPTSAPDAGGGTTTTICCAP